MGNLTKKIALQSHKDQHSLTIKLADKGGNIVIMSNDQYKLMCKKIVQNSAWYKPVPRCIIERFNMKFYSLVDDAYLNGAMDKDTWDFIRTKHPKTCTKTSATLQGD